MQNLKINRTLDQSNGLFLPELIDIITVVFTVHKTLSRAARGGGTRQCWRGGGARCAFLAAAAAMAALAKQRKVKVVTGEGQFVSDRQMRVATADMV